MSCLQGTNIRSRALYFSGKSALKERSLRGVLRNFHGTYLHSGLDLVVAVFYTPFIGSRRILPEADIVVEIWPTLRRICTIPGVRSADNQNTISINLLELIRMVMKAWVVVIMFFDQPNHGEIVSFQDENTSATAWVNRCGGTHDPRAVDLL